MRTNKYITAILLSILTFVAIFPMQTFAAGLIDAEQNVELTVSYRGKDIPLSGAEFHIYHVAGVNEYGELEVTDDFEKYPVNIASDNNVAWNVLASTLEGYVLRDHITAGDSGKTDEQGILHFPTGENVLRQGLYLVIGQRHIQEGKIYETVPFMVLLPEQDIENNEWNYTVVASPKNESTPETDADTVTRKVLKVWKDEGSEDKRPQEIVVQLLCDGKVYDSIVLNADNNWRYIWNELNDEHSWTVVEKEVDGYAVEVTQEGITFVVTNTYEEISSTPTEPGRPTNSTLPQTGQLWWPVPVLISGGLLLIIIGLLRHRGGKYEK